MRGLALATALVLGGCARLSTEHARYADREVIQLRFENRGPTQVRYWPCYPSLERRTDQRWEPADWVDADEGPGRRNPLRHQCVLISYRLPPHERLSWTLRVAPGSPSGVYRFAITRRHGHDAEPLRSAPFEYVAAARTP
jgi:hypothetical protein